MLQQKVRLQAATPHIQPRIQTVQGDTGRQLVCVIEDYEIPSGASASFWAVKPSGKGIQNIATISGQEITITLTNQTLAECGWIACQLQITSSGQTVKTFKFCLENKESLAGDWPPSENESTWLNDKLDEMQKQIDQAIVQTQDATSAANEATQEAKNSADNANAAADEARETVWNNKNLTNYTSAAESQVETAASAAVLTGIDGKTKQTTMTGAQLLDVRSKISSNSSGLTVSFSGDGELILNGTTADVNSPDIYLAGTWGATEPIATGTTALKVYGATSNEEIYLINGTTSVHYKGDSSITSEQPVTAVMIRMSKGKTYNNFRIKPMLNAGKTALPWEPYSGGIPAPNPDYPMPIQGVGGQTGDENFECKAVVQSKNLLDYVAWKKSGIVRGTAVWRDNGVVLTSDTSGDCYTSHNLESSNVLKIPVKSGRTYVLSWDCDSSGGNVYVFYDGITANNRSVGCQAKKNTFTVPDGVTFVTIRVGVTPANTTIAYKNVMLTEGESVPSWQPYLHSEISMALSQPIFEGDKLMQVKAGQSYVDVDGATQTADRDMWGIYKTKGMIKFSGETEEYWIHTSGWKNNAFSILLKNKISFVGAKDYNTVPDYLFCNYGKKLYANGVANGNVSNGVALMTDTFYVYAGDICSKGDKVAFKEYLKEHPLYVIAELTNKYFEPFADQTPFFAWTTPTGGCTITTDDPLEPIISADTAQTPEGSYLLTGYIDGLRAQNNETVIAALSNQVVALTQKSMEG